jgi:hypothetical protein
MLEEAGLLEDTSMLGENSMLEDSSMIDDSSAMEDSGMINSSVNNSTLNTGDEVSERFFICGNYSTDLLPYMFNHGCVWYRTVQ